MLNDVEDFAAKETVDSGINMGGAEWVEIGCQMLMARPFWPSESGKVTSVI
jgi:hypothetical protein